MLQNNEEVSYNLHQWMRDQAYGINYGIGKTIQKAFEDFKTRLE